MWTIHRNFGLVLALCSLAAAGCAEGILITIDAEGGELSEIDGYVVAIAGLGAGERPESETQFEYLCLDPSELPLEISVQRDRADVDDLLLWVEARRGADTAFLHTRELSFSSEEVRRATVALPALCQSCSADEPFCETRDGATEAEDFECSASSAATGLNIDDFFFSCGHPCEEVDCSGHGHCEVVEEAPHCVCDDDYHPEGLACEPDEVPDPCDGITCSDHGRCEVVADAPTCFCDEDYHPEGLTCEPDELPDPCNGVNCSDHGTCVEDDGNARCECETNYVPEGLDCVPALPPALIEDDFDDEELDLDLWRIDAATWSVSDGELVAGPSCRFWTPPCAEGPAIITSTDFPSEDRTFTLEFDVYLGSTMDGRNSVRAMLHDADFELGWNTEDYLTGLGQSLLTYLDAANPCTICRLWDLGSGCVNEVRSSVALPELTWHHVVFEICEGSYSIIVSNRSDESIVWSASNSQDLRLPAGVANLRLTFFSEGRHRIDNVRLTRGCSD